MRTPLRLAVITVLTLVLAGPIPAGANATAITTTAPPTASQTGMLRRVTLITGDVVTFAHGSEKAFTVDPAQRPDGRPVTFTGRTGATIATSRDFYVIPSDVDNDSRYDPELFNITGLVREGLDRAESLPVLVRGAVPAEGARAQKALPGNGLASVKVDHSTRGQFVQGLGKDAKVWLNHRRTVSLDWSVPQTGAPAAWGAGYDGTGVTVAVIDTGIDKTHPDLAGRVIAEQNFAVDDPDAGDYYGHGTHVASAIAGSGAASGGKYKGVAPGARLINAKACSAEGYCYDDWIMAAMDYAAHWGAKVINMSLGGGVSDGSDPLSLEVNRLTSETGALFVIAAGNAGEFGPVTVGSPGAAQAALTVGAVDRHDRLAPFSSRGPRYLDAGVKPDLTAPGVGIVAARAAGTSMGSPVGEHYTAASGTSMATPHVAGAAAILAQRHPQWTAGRLKDTLVSTAHDTDAKITDEGAGRVDIGTAYAAQVTGSSSVDAGRLPRGTVKKQEVVYRNDSGRHVLLWLRLSGSGWNGRALPWAAALITPVIVVPPHSHATAHLLINTHLVEPGSYSAVIIATRWGGGVSLRTPVSYYVVPPANTLTVKVLDSTGRQIAPAPGNTYILRDDFDPERNNDPFAELLYFGQHHSNGDVTASVPAGTYTAISQIWQESVTARTRYHALSTVDIPVRSAATITLDARKALPVTVTAGAAQPRVHNIAFTRIVRGGAGVAMGCACSNAEAFALPAPAPRFGQLSLQDTWTFAERVTTLRAGGTEIAANHNPAAAAAAFPGSRTIPVVFAGDGSDFTGIDVTGKVALAGVRIPAGAEDPPYEAFVAAWRAAQNATAAGAAAVAVYADADGAAALRDQLHDIPFLGLSRADGLLLRAAVALEITSKPAPAYIYNLHYSAPNGIIEPLAHTADPARLTKVDSEYHADIPGLKLTRAFIGFRKDVAATMATPIVEMTAPAAVTEYVGGSPDAISNVAWTRIGQLSHSQIRDTLTMYSRLPFTGKDIWFAGPSSPGGFDPADSGFVRFGLPGQAQLLAPSVYMGDGTAGHLVSTGYFGYRATGWRLYRDGQEITPIEDPYSPIPYFPVPDQQATYRLDAVTELPDGGMGGPTKALRRLSHRVDTSWTFPSSRGTPAACPPYECTEATLLQPFYDLRLDLYNNAPAGRHTIGVELRTTTTSTPVTPNSFSASYSIDEGATWRSAHVERTPDGRYQVSIDNPASGNVWLRVSASTPGGLSITQTVQRIYSIA